MTVGELIEMLKAYPPEMRVALLDPDTRYCLRLEISVSVAVEDSTGGEFKAISISGDYDSEAEGFSWLD